ncbi:MAG: alpha/beta hydrolase [Fimbriimonadaceae bacterium]
MISALFFVASMGPVHTDIPPTIRLWEHAAPGSKGNAPEDVPMLTSFVPDAGATGAAFVVCPGGGYGMLADHEGKPVAEWLNTLGITAFVLRYRLGPKYHYPYITGDVMRAMRLVRSNASAWNLDPKRIGICGFSAGGHLAASAATLFDAGNSEAADPIDRESSRPDAAVLVYPVITMKDPFTHAGSRENLLGKNPSQELIDRLSIETRVTAATPPTFLAGAADDTTVPMENSLGYIAACLKFKVPVEVHFYMHGPHGFGLARIIHAGV